VHSLKYVVGRHWLRSHRALASVVVILFVAVVYVIAR